MHTSSVAARAVQRDGPPATSRTRVFTPWLVPLCYLLAAIGLTWRLWADPAGRAPTPGTSRVLPDVYLNAWFMRYAAAAVAHGHLPALVTTAVNWPQGVNAMWNTSLLLPSVVLTPVTQLWGPVVSLAVLTTLGLAGSAAAMFTVLRRWGASTAAAVAGGALYGFSPALLVAAGDHYHLEFAVLPPLIVDAVLRLVTGRARHPLRTGAWLGLLVAGQTFIAEEMLVDTALAVIVVLVVLAASRPRAVRACLRPAAAGLGVAAAIALLLSGHALWVQFHGPLTETGSPWRIGRYGNQLADFVTPPQVVLAHGAMQQFMSFLAASGQRLVEYYAYLGWPLLALLIALIASCWRDLKIRACGLSFVVLEVFSIGGHTLRVNGWRVPGVVLPWHWLEQLPVLSQVLPNRISILADGAAAVTLAFAAERAWAWAAARGGQRPWLRPALAAAALIAILPVIPRPVTAGPVSQPPAGYLSVLAALRLRPGAAVLVLPVYGPTTMQWQAATGEPISLIGGYCIAPGVGGRAAECDTQRTLSGAEHDSLLRMNLLAEGRRGAYGPPPRMLATALKQWRPAAIITVDGSGSAVARYLISYLGPPTSEHGRVLGWRLTGLPRLRHPHHHPPATEA